MKIAIQGVRGAFHETAARDYFKNKYPIDIVEKLTFEDVTNSVANDESDYGLIAIENTIAGTIHANLNLLRRKEVEICGEKFIRIKQNLAVLPGVSINDLTEVRSHYIALNQTREFFRNYPNIRLVECESTAIGIRQVSENKLETVGAVGSEQAAQLYGLQIIAEEIETNKKNYTRFFVIKKKNGQNNVQDFNKASLSIILSSHQGSLASILSIISFYGVDLSKIESQPIIGRPMHYRFYIDLRFTQKEMYKKMLQAIEPLLSELEVLGEYNEDQESWELIHNQ